MESHLVRIINRLETMKVQPLLFAMWKHVKPIHLIALI